MGSTTWLVAHDLTHVALPQASIAATGAVAGAALAAFVADVAVAL